MSTVMVHPDIVHTNIDGSVTVMDWKTESADGLRSASTKELPRGRVAAWPAVRDYVFAGAAVFTLLSLKTGARYTFKVRAKKEDLEKARIREEHRRPDNSQSRPDLPEIDICYFVNLLRGQDNTKDFTYLGVLRRPGNFFITPASRVKREAAAYKALVWFLDQMRNERDVLGGQVEFWHNGRCGRCGRLLTVPKSVADGVGPECMKYAGRT
jgi:hypothetical protein